MTDLKRDPGRKAYYDQGASWAADVHGSLRASRKLAWYVAGGACAVALLEAFALAALAPLKTVVPYTISVDRQTGYVETVRPLAPGAMSQDVAVTQANLVQYVLARETYDATDLRDAYRKVTLWSAGDARDQYMRLMRKTTPESPLNLYGAHTVVSVEVKSISLLTPTTALVRFQTTRQDPGGGMGELRPWVAAITFRYSGAPMSMGDRFLDPLGFQVTRYRRDAEAPFASAANPTAAVAPTPAAAVATTISAATGAPAPIAVVPAPIEASPAVPTRVSRVSASGTQPNAMTTNPALVSGSDQSAPSEAAPSLSPKSQLPSRPGSPFMSAAPRNP